MPTLTVGTGYPLRDLSQYCITYAWPTVRFVNGYRAELGPCKARTVLMPFATPRGPHVPFAPSALIDLMMIDAPVHVHGVRGARYSYACGTTIGSCSNVTSYATSLTVLMPTGACTVLVPSVRFTRITYAVEPPSVWVQQPGGGRHCRPMPNWSTGTSAGRSWP